ncbi:MAG: hypothetical protein JWM16_2067 [Verrucomicrobiales bacterium]|nr:hypothetical protein [Verrucomicrobiales bacterium]
MKNSEKKWLESGSWQSVVNLYQTLCNGQKLDPLLTKSNFDKARQYWESQTSKSLSLPQALEVCQKCYEMGPFIFNNGNVFATFAKQLVESWVKTLPSVEAQMLQLTVGHYVTGKVSRKELTGILDFLAPSWEKFQASSTLVTLAQPQPLPEPRPEAQPAMVPARELVAS